MGNHAHPNRDFMSTVAVLMAAVNCNEVGRKTTDMLQDGHDWLEVEGVEWVRKASVARRCRPYQNLDLDFVRA